MSLTRKVFTGFLTGGAASMFEYTLRIPRVIIMTRILGPEFYGVLGLFGAFREIVGRLLGLGTGDAIIQFLAEAKRRNETSRIAAVMSAGRIIRSLMLVLFVLGYLLGESTLVDYLSTFSAARSITREQLYWLLRIIAVGLVIQALEAPFGNALQGFQAWKALLTVRLVGSIASTGIPIAAALLGFGIIGVVSAQQIAFAVIACMIFYFYLRNVHPTMTQPPVNKRVVYIREMLVFGLPLVFSQFFFMIYTYTDTVMLGKLASSPEELSYFELGKNLSDVLMFAPALIRDVMFPAAAEYFAATSVERIQALFRFLFKNLFVILLPFVVFFALFSKEIILVVSGDQYVNATGGLALFYLLVIPRALGVPFFTCLVGAFRQTKSQFNITLAGGVANVLLNLYFIPRIGYLGAIIATALSSVLALSLGYYYLSKHMKILLPLVESFKAIFAATLMASITLIAKDIHLYVSLVVVPPCLLGYFIVIIRLSVFNVQDIDKLSKLLDRLLIKSTRLRCFLKKHAGPFPREHEI